MKNKQLAILFLCNLIIFTAAGGLIPLLPIYITRLGASSAVAGLYLGFGFLMLIAGAALMGQLRRRLTPHTLFITMTFLMGVAIILVGQANSLFVLFAFISLWWFGAGIAMILINIFAGLAAEAGERGRIFAFVNLAIPLGSIIGGVTLGKLADWYGYPTLFFVVGLSHFLLPLLAWFGLAAGKKGDKTAVSPPSSPPSANLTTSSVSTWTFGLIPTLLVTTMLVSTASFVGSLGLSLTMERLAYSAASIGSTATVGGAVSLLLLPLVGRLSDRLGRRPLLVVGYLFTPLSLILLSQTFALWHFWTVQGLLTLANVTTSSLTAAWFTDLLPKQQLEAGLAKLNSMIWLGGFVGYASGGYLLATIEPNHLFWGAAVLGITAVVLLGLPRNGSLSAPVAASQQ